MGMIVTEYIRQRVLGAGACRSPKVGTNISRIPQEDLVWVENAGILSAVEVASLPAPLWALASAGSGSGSGYGSGSGDAN